MAFPSIILFLIYQLSVGMTFSSFSLVGAFVMRESILAAAWVGFAALVSAGAAWVYWKRFQVPIAIAAIASSAIGVLGAMVFGLIAIFDFDTATSMIPAIGFVLGLGVFAGALAFDASDRDRITQRADIAFWLHLLAAPLMVHPVFQAFGVTSGDIGAFGALVVIALYCVFGAIALVVDRRALLVSALLYVAIALAMLFGELGSVGLTSALSALVIGAGLLTLSVFWASLRSFIVERLPLVVQAQVPAIASAVYDGDSDDDYNADDRGRYRAY